MWVHLFVKRSYHRTNPDKSKNDLYDAQNYLNIMQVKIDAAKRSADLALNPPL